MPSLERDEDIKTEKLKAALWYAIGQSVDSISLHQALNATTHFIGGLSEMVWAQIGNVANDLEAFAKHSSRSTINCKDVILLGRRNEGLEEILKSQADMVRKQNGNAR